MSILTKARLRGCLVLAATTLVAGCITNPLGQTGGVLPASDVGPPPSARADLRAPARSATPSQVDPERVMPTQPTRRLDVPTTTRGSGTASAETTRRIRREDLEDAGQGKASGSGGLTPRMTPGGVGLGGSF
ncbi:hypothetical protein [Methylobacterium isbiliense]|jgi:hypothetical protein|uniref:Lipoprotein n=1 Tax=Methylobacterium isbiliense TaxID=315478 RepID=A0ABQ4SFT3_9HYPH|nr:hypothetical protein [Methylobacterium isbiliense]MDN3623993.1 hypothetical protein [Methylobacterium isbiliense]GJE02082.1 hypothetical protein GMJLKIPL_4026 [Methylobacterium isbiliense]